MTNICLAEWLRRWTRNPLGHSRVGSNPAADETFFWPFFVGFVFLYMYLPSFFLQRFILASSGQQSREQAG